MKIEQFEKLKDISLGHNLIKAGRVYKEYSFQKIKNKVGVDELRPAHIDLLAFISFGGITIVEISKKMDISKQAVSVLVNEMIEFGVLKKLDNPKDKRSFLVSFNQESDTGVFFGLSFLSELDEELKKTIGKKNSNLVLSSLLKVISKFDVS